MQVGLVITFCNTSDTFIHRCQTCRENVAAQSLNFSFCTKLLQIGVILERPTYIPTSSSLAYLHTYLFLLIIPTYPPLLAQPTFIPTFSCLAYLFTYLFLLSLLTYLLLLDQPTSSGLAYLHAYLFLVSLPPYLPFPAQPMALKFANESWVNPMHVLLFISQAITLIRQRRGRQI